MRSTLTSTPPAETASGTNVPPKSYRSVGVAFVLLAAVSASLTGILLRQIEAADAWQVLFYRSGAFSLVLLLIILGRHGGHSRQAFRAIGWPGILAAACLAATFVAFILAMTLTTVAATVFVFSASPFFAALLAWLLLREPVAPRTWIGMTIALPGVGLMVADGLLDGGLVGNLIALAAAVGYAASIVALRMGRGIDMLPVVFLAGLFAMAASGLLTEDLAVGQQDLGFALLLGAGPLGLQYIFLTLGARRLPAAEVTLLTLVEAVLSPFWVWFGVGELPGVLTLFGGGVLLAAVAGHALSGLRRSAPKAG